MARFLLKLFVSDQTFNKGTSPMLNLILLPLIYSVVSLNTLYRF